ncbi:POP7 protein, partial [Eubucco bourcierii]|nr:POP7 protein [Eubucco bourcierii]
DIFVTTRTDFRAQLRRCQRLLLAPPPPGGAHRDGGGGLAPARSQETPPQELRLHGLGLAVPRAINLALQLLAGAPPGTLTLQASTSSVPLLCPPRAAQHRDHPHQQQEEEEEEEEEEGGEGATFCPPTRLRHNSAIHIRVCR